MPDHFDDSRKPTQGSNLRWFWQLLYLPIVGLIYSRVVYASNDISGWVPEYFMILMWSGITLWTIAVALTGRFYFLYLVWAVAMVGMQAAFSFTEAGIAPVMVFFVVFSVIYHTCAWIVWFRLVPIGLDYIAWLKTGYYLSDHDNTWLEKKIRASSLKASLNADRRTGKSGDSAPTIEYDSGSLNNNS